MNDIVSPKVSVLQFPSCCAVSFVGWLLGPLVLYPDIFAGIFASFPFPDLDYSTTMPLYISLAFAYPNAKASISYLTRFRTSTRSYGGQVSVKYVLCRSIFRSAKIQERVTFDLGRQLQESWNCGICMQSKNPSC